MIRPRPAGAAGELVDAADGEHLGAVLGGGDVPDRLALDPDGRTLGSEVAVGVDFHLHPAVGKDALGDHRHRVHALVLGGDDEGRGLVVRVGGARSDAGDEGAIAGEDPAVPVLEARARERHHRRARFERPLRQHQRVGSHQHPVLVGVAVAGAELSGLDAAQDGAGVAANDPGLLPGARACPCGRRGRVGGRDRSSEGAGARRCSALPQRHPRRGTSGGAVVLALDRSIAWCDPGNAGICLPFGRQQTGICLPFGRQQTGICLPFGRQQSRHSPASGLQAHRRFKRAFPRISPQLGGNVGVPPARNTTGPRRVVHCGPSARAGGTPALPGTSPALRYRGRIMHRSVPPLRAPRGRGGE